MRIQCLFETGPPEASSGPSAEGLGPWDPNGGGYVWLPGANEGWGGGGSGSAIIGASRVMKAGDGGTKDGTNATGGAIPRATFMPAREAPRVIVVGAEGHAPGAYRSSGRWGPFT